MTVTILQGNVIDTLKSIEAGTVRCTVTSPPYYGLRSYLKADDPLKQFEIGTEKTPEEYVAKLVAVGRELWRVLSDDGTLWLNLGDSYWGGKGQSSQAWSTEHQDRNTLQKAQHQITGAGLTRPTDGKHPVIKAKDLIGIPWMVAFALRADGWYLRSDIIWAKPNPMPESVKDRPTKSHEHIFLLSKSEKYHYDAVAIAEPSIWATKDKRSLVKGGVKSGGKTASGQYALDVVAYRQDGLRNKRDVWTVTTKPYKGAHFATFPPDLIEPCILAGTSEKGKCPQCGAAWTRVVEKTTTLGVHGGLRKRADAPGAEVSPTSVFRTGADTKTVTTGWRAGCECGLDPIPDVVLDPFGGSGTTAMVAIKHGRNAILCELNAEYLPLIEKRVGDVQTSFA